MNGARAVLAEVETHEVPSPPTAGELAGLLVRHPGPVCFPDHRGVRHAGLLRAIRPTDGWWGRFVVDFSDGRSVYVECRRG